MTSTPFSLASFSSVVFRRGRSRVVGRPTAGWPARAAQLQAPEELSGATAWLSPVMRATLIPMSWSRSTAFADYGRISSSAASAPATRPSTTTCRTVQPSRDQVSILRLQGVHRAAMSEERRRHTRLRQRVHNRVLPSGAHDIR
jgi:hypothetical protein